VALGGSVALAIGLGIGRFAFTPLLPMMEADAGVTILSGSWLAAANYAGYLAGALAGVRWRLASPTVIRAGLIAVAASTFGMGVTNDYLAWLLLRAIAGAASAWILVATSAWTVATLAATGHAYLSAVVFSGVGLGIAVTGTLVLAATAAGQTSSETWVALGFVALITTATSWNTLLRDAGNGRPAPRAAAPVRRNGRWGPERTALLVTCYGIFGFGYIIPATSCQPRRGRSSPIHWCSGCRGRSSASRALVPHS
jgi:MFS family permease